ncbi:MAG: putative Zn-dependent protease [Marivirga sp.]|jgi:predicted Zn-dependent protease
MTKNHLFIIIFFISILNVCSQDVNVDSKNQSSEFSDGPYVFIENNMLIQKEIINGQVLTKNLKVNAFDTLFTPNKEVYRNVKKIAALSDIHGQYDLAIEILRNNKIIDQKLNWNFGKGHLVIVGDVFDRGDKVNEILLLIYKLERQATDKGGRVHFLLGNHEYMVLHKDLRYVSEKYQRTSQLLNVNYDELYSNETVIGRWLRSKPTIIKINNNVFVHGGVSKDFISSTDFGIENINNIMRSSIERDKAEMKSSNFYDTYYGKKSLIWYRGYFNDNLKDKDISEVLNLTDSEHIVVGHCSNEEVVSLFANKIFGVDSSIKKGKYGEILFIRNDKYVRKTLKGKKKHFD